MDYLQVCHSKLTSTSCEKQKKTDTENCIDVCQTNYLVGMSERARTLNVNEKERMG